MAQPARQLVLAVQDRLHPATQSIKIAQNRFGQAGGAGGGAHGDDQKDEKQKHQRRAAQRHQHQRVVERIALAQNLDHVRPNSRSISASFSST